LSKNIFSLLFAVFVDILAIAVTDFLYSTFMVFASEMGDKTQLLSLMLVTRFKKPWTILLAVLVATILNHALAAWLGVWAAGQFNPNILRWVLFALFTVFGLWLLIPDKVDDDMKSSSTFGAFMTTLIAFFIAEMGDKTQLATVALGAQFQNAFIVTAGSTLGMFGANALAIFIGPSLLKKIPMTWVRIFACVLFIGFGLAILFGFGG
jgi:Ca2+/H+ antiporter, TMEM165/GDT1 family